MYVTRNVTLAHLQARVILFSHKCSKLKLLSNFFLFLTIVISTILFLKPNKNSFKETKVFSAMIASKIINIKISSLSNLCTQINLTYKIALAQS